MTYKSVVATRRAGRKYCRSSRKTCARRLLGEGQIKPIISARFPLMEAAKAYQLLESGQAIGNIVLIG
jgi:NADPH:quinone reductase-like Zn-dependent oxidoreductase